MSITRSRAYKAGLYITVEKPIIVIGKLLSWHKRTYPKGDDLSSSAIFKVEGIIKGEYYFKKKLELIKCYFINCWIGYSDKKHPVYPGVKVGLKGVEGTGITTENRTILFLDKDYLHPVQDSGGNSEFRGVNDIYDENVFYFGSAEHGVYSLYSEKDYEINHKYSGKYSFDEYIELIKKVEELNKKEVFIKSRGGVYE